MNTTPIVLPPLNFGKYYAVLPTDGSLNIKYKDAGMGYTAVEEGFSYTSGNNSNFLTSDEIRDLIRKNIDPNFREV